MRCSNAVAAMLTINMFLVWPGRAMRSLACILLRLLSPGANQMMVLAAVNDRPWLMVPALATRTWGLVPSWNRLKMSSRRLLETDPSTTSTVK